MTTICKHVCVFPTIAKISTRKILALSNDKPADDPVVHQSLQAFWLGIPARPWIVIGSLARF